MSLLQLHEFFVEGNDPYKSHVLLNITEPSTPEEMKKGYFFAVCEITDGDNNAITKVQEMIDEIENKYYETADETDRSSLEIILDNINEQFIFIARKEIGLNCVIGAIRDSEILFSFYGHPEMLLFYKTREGEYKKMDLIKENEPDAGEEGQLFSQLIQGKISGNDYLFVSTSKIIDYFNHDRLQKIISSRPPRQSAEHLQRVLAELKNDLSFGGIITHQAQNENGPALAAPKVSLPKKGSVKSLSSLFSTERNTARIMSPSIFPRLQDKLSEAGETPQSPEEAPAEPPTQTAEISSMHFKHRAPKAAPKAPGQSREIGIKILKTLRLIFKYLFFALLWILKFIIGLIAGIGQTIGLLFIALINFRGRRPAILAQWSRGWRSYRDYIKQLPTLTKIFVLSSLFIAVAVLVGGFYIKINQKKEAQLRAFNSGIDATKNKVAEAESALIYNNTAAATADLAQAKQTLDGLDCAVKGQGAQCQELQTQMENLAAKARKIIYIEPQLLANWNPAKVSKIFILQKNIFGFDSSTSSVMTYNPVSKQVAAIPASAGFTMAAVPKENDYAALLSGKTISLLKPDNSIAAADIEYPKDNANITAAVVYNRKLYAVDSVNNQIYKHDGIRTGFSRGKEWLSDPADFKDAVDLAIDGDLFVLLRSGGVDKFTSGKKQTFSVLGVDPPLVSADEIYTYTDLNYLYILDGSQKRIVILDKTGQLVRQVSAPPLGGATGMIVDEASATAMFTSGNKLYQIGLK